MPLSEGATRARHARRLLQRVLDYAPDGTTIHPIVRIGRHAAEGIVEASAEQEADLIIFGWGGRAGRRPGRDRAVGLLADDRRGRPRVAVRHRRRQAARLEGDPAHPRARSAAAPTPSSRSASPTPSRATTTRRSSSSTSSRRASRWRSGPRRSAPSPRSSSSTSPAAARPLLREAPNVRNAILREAEKADLVVMGASAQPGGADGETYLFGALPEAIAARAQARRSSSSRPARRIERTTFDQLAARAETLAAADRAAEEARAVPVRVERWFGESNFHHAEFADLRRLVTLKEKQRLTISLVLPTLDEEETIGPDRPPGDARDGRAGAAARRGPRHRLGVDRPDARDRRGRGRARRPAPRRPAALRLVRRQGRGPLEVALRDDRRHHRVGRHGRAELAPPDGLRDARAAPARAAPAVRQGLLPAPDRRRAAS